MPREAIRFGYTQSNDEIFAVGGMGGGMTVLSHLQLYNINLEQWIDAPIKKLSLFYDQSAVYLPEYKGIFLAGGIKPKGNDLLLIDDIRMLYIDNLKIDSLGQLPFPAKNMGIAVHEKRVFMFGGSTYVKRTRSGWKRGFSNKLMVYNLENGHLHVYPDMPMARNTQGGIIGRYLYTLGGYNGKSLKSVWRFDLLEESWEKLKPLKRPMSGYALVQHKQYFILIGGFHHQNKLMVYDTETQKSYEFKTNLNAKFQGASIINEQLHVYGGSKKGHFGYIGHHILPMQVLLKALKQLKD